MINVEQKKPKILVVEDESIVAIDLSHTLVSLGYDVVDTAGTGEEALSIIKRKKPDLVLMDIQLRGDMDGIQVAERIQNTLRIPVIYLSAYSDAQTLSRARQTEPYGYIQKSFDHNDLHSTIEMALHKSKMEQRLIEKERLLSTTFRSIREAVITTSNTGAIRLINSSAEELLGIRHEQIIGRRINDLGLLFLDYSTRCEVFPFGDPDTLPSSGFEVSYPELPRSRFFLQTGGRVFPVELTCSLNGNDLEEIRGFVIVFRNIEEEHNFQEMQARLVSIINSSDDAIIGSSPEGAIRSWNRGAESIFGFSFDEIRGKNLSLLIPDYYPNEMPDVLERLAKFESIGHYEAVRKTKTGQLLDMSIRVSPIRDAAGAFCGASIIARDITARKTLEKQLLEIQDRERTRIGQDLHDSLGQHLTGILLKLKALENDIKKGGYHNLVPKTSDIQALTKAAVNETRELAKGLIPVTVQSEGLASAIKELCYYTQSIHGFDIRFQIEGDVDCVPADVNIQLYHIAQEAINNAVKHALPKIIEVGLYHDSTELVLSIKDDGCGMSSRDGGGIGLRIMEYRANMINARFFIESNNRSGTRIMCRVPASKTGGEIE